MEFYTKLMHGDIILYDTIFDHKKILQQDQSALLIMVWDFQDILDLKFGTLYHLILQTLETLKNLGEKLCD